MALRKLLLIVMCSSVVVSSCKKDDDPEPTPPSPSSTTTPAPSVRLNANLHMNMAQVPPLTISAASAFFDGPNGLPTSAGDVYLNGDQLPYDFLFYNLSSQSTPGFSLASGETNWTVTGGNGYPAFQHTMAAPFPTLGSLTSAETIDISEGYTLSVGEVSGADSVRFQLDILLIRTVAGNVTSYTFSPEDLASIDAGSISVRVGAIKYESVTHGGKRVQYEKERSISDWFTAVE